MKNLYLETKFSKFVSMFLILMMAVPMALVPSVASADPVTTIFSDNFGTGPTNSGLSSLGWSEGGNTGDDAEMRTPGSSNDTASPDDGRFAVMFGPEGYICRTINTTGYNNVNLSYYWRGDDDSSSSGDNAFVEIKATGPGVTCSNTSGWTQLKEHDMRTDSSWTTQTPFTNTGMNNSSFLLRFRTSTNDNDEHFRVDGINIVGTPISVPENTLSLCQDQQDNDLDGQTDSADSDCNQFVDSDNDQVPDYQDNCPAVANPNQEDTDNDGVGDACDNCPQMANADQADTNENQVGDVCEASDPEPETATIVATKIVCPTEDLLPNWGDGGPSITANTASDFLAQNPTCHEEKWDFEWAPNGTNNPGDNVGVAGGSWTAFSGNVSVSANSLVWVREQVNENYIPFSGDTDPNDGWDDVSAEIYCNTDVLNYDNYDWVDPVEAGQTYYCVAFNVLKEIPPVCNPEVNLVENGSFEDPIVTNGALWDIFPTVLGWNIEWMNPTEVPAPSLELHRGVNGWLPADLAQYAELDGDWYGPSNSSQGALTKIYQDIPTIAGKNYELKFSFSPRPNTGEGDNVLGVLWGGAEVSGSPFVGSNATNQTIWSEQTLNLVGDGSVKRLQFEG